MAVKFKTEKSYKEITFDEVADYLEANGTKEEKAEFKKACYSTSKGEITDKFNWLNGKLWFCNKFAPQLVPEKKTVIRKADRIANW